MRVRSGVAHFRCIFPSSHHSNSSLTSPPSQFITQSNHPTTTCPSANYNHCCILPPHPLTHRSYSVWFPSFTPQPPPSRHSKRVRSKP
ncbi:hypothetical protein ECG_09167 [Echinococcus granulosus]|uniref:Expressed protein n=1 Tax=Echinococcus granulosus TaxID=6210 RepID=A0A068WU78_ECHGR|nr:hypothetical protein ECG_09167 [Echinococcus granulosus]CDS21231.1 expressed protein [Echinococcus granulosus]